MISSSYKVLFANPDEKLSQIYTRHLKNHFQIDSASDGLIAIRKIKVMNPSLVISEYRLPLISGPALLKFIRDQKKLYIPFMFLTNHHDNSEALNLGANDWITLHSCSPDYLLNRIYYHLNMNRYAL